jgi:hypothetical protein
VLSVTVAGEPKVAVGQPVTVADLVAMPWNQDGRSGVAYRARRSPAPVKTAWAHRKTLARRAT